MVTFFDLQKNDEFRIGVSQRIATMVHDPCFFLPNKFPILYRYRSLSKYAVDDITTGKLTLTSIGAFNDLFDGAFHRFGSDEKRKNKAEEEWQAFEKLRIAAGLKDQLLDHDYLTNLYANHYKQDSRLKFRELEYLGTYVCCFSSRNDSTLMWSHYANANSGICVAYDFNKLNYDNLLRWTFFPVVYTSKPFDLEDLLDEKNGKTHNYPLETAVLCAAINKALEWKYENEWRIVWVLAGSSNEQRFQINSLVQPRAVYFGYHFLKNLFYYGIKDVKGREEADQRKRDLNRLLDYMDQKHIPAFMMVPEIGTYNQTPIPVDVSKMKGFMIQRFNDRVEDIRFYHVIHDWFMDDLEKEQVLYKDSDSATD